MGGGPWTPILTGCRFLLDIIFGWRTERVLGGSMSPLTEGVGKRGVGPEMERRGPRVEGVPDTEGVD